MYNSWIVAKFDINKDEWVINSLDYGLTTSCKYLYTGMYWISDLILGAISFKYPIIPEKIEKWVEFSKIIGNYTNYMIEIPGPDEDYIPGFKDNLLAVYINVYYKDQQYKKGASFDYTSLVYLWDHTF
jgi:hypothetical protein